MTDEQALIPPESDDDLRFAPAVDPAADEIESATEEDTTPGEVEAGLLGVDLPDEAEDITGDDEPDHEATGGNNVAAAPLEDELIFGDEALALPAEAVDLDAALAAVSSLDDMLAEQEAAELAEQAQQQAQIEAREQAEARLRNPEYFFAMPPMLTMQRGRLDSVIPALILILLGAWLTYSLTTAQASLDPGLVLGVAGGGIGIALIARWLATGRWAMGALFFALVILLCGGVFLFLLSSGSLMTAWPLILVGVGLAFLITGLVAGQNRLALPGLVIIFASMIALVVTQGMLPEPVIGQLAAAWPIVAVIVVLLFALPLIFRRRLRE